MAKYQVYMFCNECSDVHDMYISVNLPVGPTKKESIGNLFAGKELPPQIAHLRGIGIICPATNKTVTQQDNNQIFLVPIE